VVGQHHVESRARAYNGGRGGAPSRDIGVIGAKPPEAESFEAFECLKEGQKLVAKKPIPSKYLAIHLSYIVH